MTDQGGSIPTIELGAHDNPTVGGNVTFLCHSRLPNAPLNPYWQDLRRNPVGSLQESKCFVKLQ